MSMDAIKKRIKIAREAVMIVRREEEKRRFRVRPNIIRATPRAWAIGLIGLLDY